MRNLLLLTGFAAMITLACLQSQAADPSAVSTPSPRPPHSAGENVSTGIETHTLPAHPVGVKPVVPAGAPAQGAGSLSPAQQSSMGAGIQIPFGKGAKPNPAPTDDADAESQ